MNIQKLMKALIHDKPFILLFSASLICLIPVVYILLNIATVGRIAFLSCLVLYPAAFVSGIICEVRGYKLYEKTIGPIKQVEKKRKKYKKQYSHQAANHRP